MFDPEVGNIRCYRLINPGINCMEKIFVWSQNMSKNMNDKQYENVARQLKTCEDCKIENVKEINAIFGQS